LRVLKTEFYDQRGNPRSTFLRSNRGAGHKISPQSFEENVLSQKFKNVGTETARLPLFAQFSFSYVYFVLTSN